MKSRLLIASFLLLVSLLVRLPFFFIDVIDWDESTFILMGQSILDGHLPYTELWDLKPPLAFVPYALFIALFGKSIVAIRLGGAIFVFIISWLIYLIGENLEHRRAGILGGAFFILLSGLIPGGQAIMSEYIALVPLIGGLTILILNQISLLVLFIAGILLTTATLIRLNLAYVVVAVGFWVLLTDFRFKLVTCWRVLAYSLGSFAVILLTYIPYAIIKQGDVWLSSVVLAPLSYSNQKSVWKAFQAQIDFILCSISPLEEVNNFLPDSFSLPDALMPRYELTVELVGISLLVWAGGVMGAILIAKQNKNINSSKRRKLILLTIFFVATELSIFQSGASFRHYYIQAIPFFALGAGYFWDSLLSKKYRFLTTAAIALLISLSFKLIWVQYQLIGDRFNSNQPLNYGASYEISDYISQVNPNHEPIYLMTSHIVYWFNDLKPISKSVTHPSNISREYLLEHIPGANPVTKDELSKILATKPKLIVKPKQVGYLEKDNSSKLLLAKTLNTQYQLVKEIQDKEIYQLKL